MRLSDFDYQLPRHLIAQKPIEPRGASKLMVLHNDHIKHKAFCDIVDFMGKGDVLILNDSRVLPAKLLGRKETGGKVELLLIKRGKGNTWKSLIKGKNIKEGTRLVLGDDKLNGIVRGKIEGGRYIVQFFSKGNVDETIQELGEMPIPPYIKEILKDSKRYQTVYAKENGSIAAPTAGLHFTESLLGKLKTKGIEIVSITLHVSIGTFLPVKNQDIRDHIMEPEYYKVSADAARKINLAKDNGNNIFAVGTTTVKALESACDSSGEILAKEGMSDMFIYPGYEFEFGLDGLLTNFHLPKSTLLMLVSAFSGRDNILNAYNVAIEHSYRFYSFGDAMLILK